MLGAIESRIVQESHIHDSISPTTRSLVSGISAICSELSSAVERGWGNTILYRAVYIVCGLICTNQICLPVCISESESMEIIVSSVISQLCPSLYTHEKTCV